MWFCRTTVKMWNREFGLWNHAISHVRHYLNCHLIVEKIGQAWKSAYGVSISDAANTEVYNPEQLADEITSKSSSVKRVGFIGLGAMGFGMATQLIQSDFCVIGYDVIYFPIFIGLFHHFKNDFGSSLNKSWHKPFFHCRCLNQL